MGDSCLSIIITHTTAKNNNNNNNNSQGGQEKPALQETWVGPRQTPASPQSFYITRSRLEGWYNATNTVDPQGDNCFSFIYLVWVFQS